MANAYLVPGGNGLINSSTNWSTTSGGPSGYTPLSTDDLIADANSLNAPLITTTAVYNSLVFSGYTGNLTLTTSTTLTISRVLEYSSGMTTSGTGTLNVGSSIYSTASINFNGVSHSGNFGFNSGTGNVAYTITGDMNIIGTTAFSNSSGTGAGTKITLQGAGRVLMNGSMTIFGNGNRWLGGGIGGVSLHFVGSNSGVFTSGVNAYIFLNITFEKTGGIINNTVGNLQPRGSTVTYISGTFTNFILNMQHACIINTAGMTWASVTTSASFTNNSLLSITGTLTTSASITIAGTGDIICNTLTNTSSLGLAAGKTLNINTAWNSVATAASPFLIYSTTLSSKANIILSNSGNQDVAHTNGRDIDSDGGTTIMSYRATSIVRCDNWSTLPIITSINTNSILR